jgi:hypothetical protein
MKGIKGGNMIDEGDPRKNVCIICGPMNVHCASVLASATCEVRDYMWMGCKNDNQEGYSLSHNCPAFN